MKKNIGTIDRIIRVLLAVVVSVLFFTNVISGTVGIVLLAVGGVLLATSFINFCPLYSILGINTCPLKK
ncbi:MAG: YgaP family membrane protein [Nonlabens sp.]|uniref:YgaP family membrane protein n=1 Tax=Nonlabens sp. TaxID=1888209 RepID=UPI003EF1F4F0